ncbi:Exonuclease DPD1 [Chlorella vulgaris]
MSRREPRSACECGLPPHAGQSRSAKNPGRLYANCSRFPAADACKYFAWLSDPVALSTPATPTLEPRTPERELAPQRSTYSSEPPPATPARPADFHPGAGYRAGSAALPQQQHTSLDCVAALLIVECDTSALLLPRAQRQERVQLLLLPASTHPTAHCTQHLAVQRAEGELPWAPASLGSLQAPYLTLRSCPAAQGLAEAVGWHGPSCGSLFVLDCETTGLAGRDYIHQLAVLNVCTGQLLTAHLRTCPRITGPQAAQVCGSSNHAQHDPSRPTFGQLAPLLHAFITAGSSSSDRSSGGGGHAVLHIPPTIVAHNGGFDARMLIGEWSRRGLPVPTDWRLLDTLPLAKAFVADCTNFKQGTLRSKFGVRLGPGEAEHDAGTDVTVLAQLLPFLVQASGAGSLPCILGGHALKKNGEGYCRTFGAVQASMRAVGAEAIAFTCGFCRARVVA